MYKFLLYKGRGRNSFVRDRKRARNFLVRYHRQLRIGRLRKLDFKTVQARSNGGNDVQDVGVSSTGQIVDLKIEQLKIISVLRIMGVLTFV